MPDFAVLADAGWPAVERVTVGPWVARFADGVTQRANSVLVPGGVPQGGATAGEVTASEVADLDPAIRAVESLYRDRRLTPLFQLSPRDVALRHALESRGYSAHSETRVLAADVATVAGSLRRPPRSVGIAWEPDGDWLDLWWSVDGRGGDRERTVARRILTGGTALYATVRDTTVRDETVRDATVRDETVRNAIVRNASGVASVGRLSLVEHEARLWGGIYALATREDARGRGYARAVIGALLEAGRKRGVSDVWLQVLARNDAALRLYDGLGFAAVDSYRYLQAPDAGDAQ